MPYATAEIAQPVQWRREQQPNGRRSLHLSQSQHLPTRFSQLFSDPETDSDDNFSDDEEEESSDEIEGRRRNFLGRVQSYSKAMHAHTTFQLGSLSRSTLPSYTKTMHAFTLNQLNHHFNEGTTKSASNSPERGTSKPREVSDNDETSQAPNLQSNMTPQSETPDLMQTLPPELRNRIYELCLPELRPRFLPCEEPALLKTCRWIRSETRPIFWGNTSNVLVSCQLSSPRFQLTIEALTSIVKTCGKSPFKKITFYGIGAIRPHLIKLLPLLKMMRATGFDPTTGSYEPKPMYFTTNSGKSVKRQYTTRDSIFIMENFTHGTLQEDLETAFALPRRAREEGWTAKRFETEFKAFVKSKGTRPRPREAKSISDN
ncbi:hypothetical protein D0863_07180 [Hortaea werneckii]|uniref:F-box domain-containing protein n=1 Tax=Hortaea werneckii TaxID=91943 RepID=A0A3M7DVU3_HORWE|nr:hypothetical protein D0863_07180 [Hortaea werneckii]